MNRKQRLELAKKSLKGISIGDAFGESFFGETDMIIDSIENRKIPETSWEFTDDTVMAIAVYEQLENIGKIDQAKLATQFSINHLKDPNRGYGATARMILREIANGGDWETLSKEVFDGMGSMGNGASMRVSPIGAYYYDELDTVRKLAIESAKVTHSNEEAICGAIAVSIGTSIATRIRIEGLELIPEEYIQKIIDYLPETDTKSKIKKSLSIPYSYHIETVKSILGNGSKIMTQDTVPYCIWCAANNLNNFEEGLWKAVSVLGDRDTICAIVGGILIMSTDEKSIPREWIDSVEDFEESDFRTKN